MSEEPVTVVVGDLSDMGAEAQAAFTPSIVDSFLEHAASANKRRLEINRSDFNLGDPTTQYLLDHAYMCIVEETPTLIVFEITDAGIARGAEVIQSRLPKL